MYVDDMIVYIENLQNLQQTIGIKKEFSKDTEHNISICKSVVLLLRAINNWNLKIRNPV